MSTFPIGLVSSYNAGLAVPSVTWAPNQVAPAFIGTLATLTYGVTLTPNAQLGNEFVVVPTDGVAFALNLPTGLIAGQQVKVRIKNTFGALGAMTFGANVKAVAWVQPANGFSREIEFIYDGTNLVETFRSAADIAN